MSHEENVILKLSREIRDGERDLEFRYANMVAFILGWMSVGLGSVEKNQDFRYMPGNNHI